MSLGRDIVLAVFVATALLAPARAAPGSFDARRQADSAARPAEKLVFRKVRSKTAGGAVLDVGAPAAFDNWVTCPTVHFDGKLYRMWYSSMYHTQDGPRGVGLATSADGINWRRAIGGQPVLTVGPAGAFDSAQVLSPEVLYDGKLYRMWYTGLDGSRNATGLERERIGLATSRDGVNWRRANGGRPVLDLGPKGSPDDVQVAYPSVVREGNSYRLWYSAYSVKSNHTICVARSRDGIAWEREYEGRSVAGLTPAIAYAPSVIRRGGSYLMLYTGGYATPRPWGIFAAVSDDGHHWRMIGGGETFVPFGTGDDFDRDNLSHPFMLPLKDRLLVWYTGFNRGHSTRESLVFRIGLAEASLGKSF